MPVTVEILNPDPNCKMRTTFRLSRPFLRAVRHRPLQGHQGQVVVPSLFFCSVFFSSLFYISMIVPLFPRPGHRVPLAGAWRALAVATRRAANRFLASETSSLEPPLSRENLGQG